MPVFGVMWWSHHSHFIRRVPCSEGGLLSGSDTWHFDKWLGRQEAADDVAAALGRLDTAFAAEVSTELAKNMKTHMMSPPRQYVR